MIQMVDRPNTTPIGQDRKTLTFKALLYLNVAVYAQVCRLFCVVHIALFGLVQVRPWFRSSMWILSVAGISKILCTSDVVALYKFLVVCTLDLVTDRKCLVSIGYSS